VNFGEVHPPPSADERMRENGSWWQYITHMTMEKEGDD